VAAVVPEIGVDARLKAELIAMGRVLVPRELLEGYRLSRSTAGPGAGSASLALAWTGQDGREHRVKLAALREDDGKVPLRLARAATGGGLELRRRDGGLLLGGVRMLPIAMHAPDHCFINLEGDCIFDCAFCTATRTGEGQGGARPRTPERWVELIVGSHRRRPFQGVAITSVSPADHERLMGDYETVIRGVLSSLPGVTVGVEPPVESVADIARLKAAGASELKVNVQSPDPAILARVCPGWDLERQFAFLDEGVRVFGRGNVTSNVIVGLGEADADVLAAFERLAAMGVVPTLRVVKVSDLNRGALERALGRPLEPVPPERHLRLAAALGEALERHGLTTRGFKTMCHSCMGCDLEPGVDL
jgi:hypothetical protein